MEELIELLNSAVANIREVIDKLADREIILALAASSDTTYELDPLLTTLTGAGQALGSRMDQIRRVARDLDALTDPALVVEVN